jgi:DNA-binding response OmpR family regulator
MIGRSRWCSLPTALSSKKVTMAGNRRARILLVDGDSTVQHLRALILRMQGYDVDTAADLEAARTVVTAAGPYNLIIVDVGHFADPGLEFCEEIKQRQPRQKVLMQVDGHLYLGRESCPDKVVSKQEGPQHFVHEVERLLEAT